MERVGGLPGLAYGINDTWVQGIQQRLYHLSARHWLITEFSPPDITCSFNIILQIWKFAGWICWNISIYSQKKGFIIHAIKRTNIYIYIYIYIYIWTYKMQTNLFVETMQTLICATESTSKGPYPFCLLLTVGSRLLSIFCIFLYSRKFYTSMTFLGFIWIPHNIN